MTIIQIRLDEDENEGMHSGYFNYEFAILKHRGAADFFGASRDDPEEIDRTSYSIGAFEYLTITKVR